MAAQQIFYSIKQAIKLFLKYNFKGKMIGKKNNFRWKFCCRLKLLQENSNDFSNSRARFSFAPQTSHSFTKAHFFDIPHFAVHSAFTHILIYTVFPSIVLFFTISLSSTSSKYINTWHANCIQHKLTLLLTAVQFGESNFETQFSPLFKFNGPLFRCKLEQRSVFVPKCRTTDATNKRKKMVNMEPLL